MSLLPESLASGSSRSLAAVGLEAKFPPLRLRPEGGIDFDWYLLRARHIRSEAYRGTLRALWRGLAAALSGWVKAIRAANERKRAVAELLSLDDRGLRDLGLNRAGIYFAIDHGREDVPPPANINDKTVRSPRAA